MSSDKGKAPVGSWPPRRALASGRMQPFTHEELTRYSNWAGSEEECKIFRQLSLATQSSAPGPQSSSQYWHGTVPVYIADKLSSANPPTQLCCITELRGIASPTSRHRFEVVLAPNGNPIYGAIVVNPDVAGELRLRRLFEFSKTGPDAGEFLPIPTVVDEQPYKIYYENLKFSGAIDSLPPVLSWATTTPVVSSCGSSEAQRHPDQPGATSNFVGGPSSSKGATSRFHGRPLRQLKRAAVTTLVGDREGEELEAGDDSRRKRKKVVTSQRPEDLPERCHPCFPCGKCLSFWGEGLPAQYFENELKDFIRSPEEDSPALLPEEDDEVLKLKKLQSRKGPKSKSSEYRGVSYYDRTSRWESHIWHNGAQRFLGASLTKIQAARAYDKAALVLHPNDADINFKPSDYKDEYPFLRSLTKYQLEVYLRREAVGFGEEVKYPGVALARNARRGFQAFYKPTKSKDTKELLGYYPTEEAAVRIVLQEAKRRNNYEMAGRVMEVHHLRTVKPARFGIRVKKPSVPAGRRDLPGDLPAIAAPGCTRLGSGNRTVGAHALKAPQVEATTSQRALRSTNRITTHIAATGAAPAAKRNRRAMLNRNFRKSGRPISLKNMQIAKPVPHEELDNLGKEVEIPARSATSAANSSEQALSQQAISSAAGHTLVPFRPMASQPTTESFCRLPLATIHSLQTTPSAGADHDTEIIQAWGPLFIMSRTGSNSSFRPFGDGGVTTLPVAAPQVPEVYLGAPPHDSVQGSQVGSFAVAHVSETDTSSDSSLNSLSREVIPLMAPPGSRPSARGRNGPASEDLLPNSPASVNIIRPYVNVIRPVARRIQRSSPGPSTSSDQLGPGFSGPSAGFRSSGSFIPISDVNSGNGCEGSSSDIPRFYDLLG